jgi:hypothetical protein
MKDKSKGGGKKKKYNEITNFFLKNYDFNKNCVVTK